MNAYDETDQAPQNYAQQDLESPFLDEELFAPVSTVPWEAHLAALEVESPFGYAFDEAWAAPVGSAEPARNLVEELEHPELEVSAADEFSAYAAEEYAEEYGPYAGVDTAPAEDEAPYADETAGGEDAVVSEYDRAFAGETEDEDQVEFEEEGQVEGEDEFEFEDEFEAESGDIFAPAAEQRHADPFAAAVQHEAWDADSADEQLVYAEPELEALAFETLDSADEYADDEYAADEHTADEYAADEHTDDEHGDDEHIDDEHAFEDEDFEPGSVEQAGQLPEDETSARSPLPVPTGKPVPFAPAPPLGSYWPVVTTRKDGRTVSYTYKTRTGIKFEGMAGRRFLANRGTARWHVGIDLFANVNDVVVACEAGTIVGWQSFLTAKSGQQTRAILIEHDGSGVVVNYGEVTPDSLSRLGLAVGMRVAAGQPIGFVSDTSMLHFETYTGGTTKNARWLKAQKTPPPQLLNPTRYLLFLKEHGLAAGQGVGVQPASSRPASGQPASGSPAAAAARPPAELVRFAQRVLNVAEGERLDEDGILGRYTRGALERFRKKYDLGTGGTLDAKTELALAQRALEELRQQSLFGQLGVLDAATQNALATFKSERRLGITAGLDAATRAALAGALASGTGAPGAALDRILQIAANSEIARYRWRDRGVAPRGYIKGMALVYARVYCKLQAGDAAALEMAKANTGSSEKDALAHYAAEFRAAGMDNDTAGADTLRHLFVLLIGLGMRESSGQYCEGRDRSASNTRADTAEAGLFQTSYNVRTASSLLPQIFRHYLANPSSGFLDVFKEGVRCSSSDLENFGSGDGREFQRLSKECPAFAAEFTAVALRNRRPHWGPITRKAAEIRPECDAMLLQVQRAVDQFALCPAVR